MGFARRIASDRVTIAEGLTKHEAQRLRDRTSETIDRIARPFFSEENATTQDEITRLRAVVEQLKVKHAAAQSSAVVLAGQLNHEKERRAKALALLTSRDN